MEIKEKEKQSKDNKELRKLVALKLGKMPYAEITDEDFEKIEEINLNARLFNGAESGIGLDAINLFPHIKKLKLSNYKITQEAISSLASLECLEDLEIFGAEFDTDINFESLEQCIKRLRFNNCLPITFPYPRISDIWLNQTDIDFSNVDLKTTKTITIRNGQITNIHDLTDFPNIESVNLDGSTLIGKDESEIPEIKVGTNTRYTHTANVELFNESISDKYR